MIWKIESELLKNKILFKIHHLEMIQQLLLRRCLIIWGCLKHIIILKISLNYHNSHLFSLKNANKTSESSSVELWSHQKVSHFKVNPSKIASSPSRNSKAFSASRNSCITLAYSFNSLSFNSLQRTLVLGKIHSSKLPQPS